MTQEAWQIKGKTINLLEVNTGEFIPDPSIEKSVLDEMLCVLVEH